MGDIKPLALQKSDYIHYASKFSVLSSLNFIVTLNIQMLIDKLHKFE